MKLNCNTILNKKHSLKAFRRSKIDNKTLVDINGDLVLGWNLFDSSIYNKVTIKNHRITPFTDISKWKMLFNQKTSNQNESFFKSNKSFVNFLPKKTVLYKDTKLKDKSKKFSAFRLGTKGRLQSFLPSYNFLKFRNSLSKKSVKLSNKIAYLELSKNKNLIIRRPKAFLTQTHLFTRFDKKQKKTILGFKNRFKIGTKISSLNLKTFLINNFNKKKLIKKLKIIKINTNVQKSKQTNIKKAFKDLRINGSRSFNFRIANNGGQHSLFLHPGKLAGFKGFKSFYQKKNKIFWKINKQQTNLSRNSSSRKAIDKHRSKKFVGFATKFKSKLSFRSN